MDSMPRAGGVWSDSEASIAVEQEIHREEAKPRVTQKYPKIIKNLLPRHLAVKLFNLFD